MNSAMNYALPICLAVVTCLLIWLSLLMSQLESAVTRVTRSSLNNMMIEIQTDNETSQFVRTKKIARIHKIQRLIVNRYASSSSCAFFRIGSNVLIGVCTACICAVFALPWWSILLWGLAAALLVALFSVLMKPQATGSTRSLDIMMKHASIATYAKILTPFIQKRDAADRHVNNQELSDDEELERIQLEQGKDVIDRLVENNKFDPEVSEMLRNVLMLSETLTREIMVPRTDMICIDRDETLLDFLQLCTRSGFSRVPVIGCDVDDLVGVAYLKDAVRATAFNTSANSRAIESIVRKPMLVPESKPVDDLFHQMQTTRHHVAIVVDEYGGVAGMVTIEDALEQIVGELEDEHDRNKHAQPEQIGDKTWSMPARTSIADLEEIFEISLDEDDVDTVYGLLTKILGRVPIVGQSGVTRGLRLTAVDSAGRRKKVSTIVVEPANVETSEHTDKNYDEREHEEEKDDHDE